MQIFKIDTDGNAAVKEIEGDLKSLQTEVGGLITLANYYEEKVLTELVGNIIFVSHDNEGSTLGLTDEQIMFIKEHLKPMLYFTASGVFRKAHTFWF